MLLISILPACCCPQFVVLVVVVALLLSNFLFRFACSFIWSEEVLGSTWQMKTADYRQAKMCNTMVLLLSSIITIDALSGPLDLTTILVLFVDNSKHSA